MKYFEKQSEKKSEKKDTGLAARTAYGMLGIPGVSNYLSTPESIREKHPVVSMMMGSAGARGANAKNTGKSEMGTAVKENAIMGATTGAVVGGLAAPIVLKDVPRLLTGPKISTLGKIGVIGAVTGLSAAAGGIVGGASAPITYGLGHLFGRNTNEKKAGFIGVGLKAIKGYGANLSKGFSEVGKNIKFMGSVATDSALGNVGKKELLGLAGKDTLNIIKNNKALRNTLIGAGATGVGYVGYNKINNN